MKSEEAGPKFAPNPEFKVVVTRDGKPFFAGKVEQCHFHQSTRKGQSSKLYLTALEHPIAEVPLHDRLVSTE